MKVLNFGSMNIDNVYYLDRFVEPGETLHVDTLEINPGGKGLNQSIAVARSGVEVYHVCTYGEGGELLIEYLRTNGVDTRHIEKDTSIQGHAIVQVNRDGENCIIVYRGSNFRMNHTMICDVLDQFDSSTYVLLQNEINDVSFIIQEAHKRGMKVVLNPSPINDIIHSLDFACIDWLILNQIEAQSLTGKFDYYEALDYFKAKFPNMGIVLTLGSQGSICVHRNQRYMQPAIKVDVKDSTGAGDTFTGYFVSGLCEGLSLDVNLERATLASGISVSRLGAAPSIPELSEVIEMSKKLRRQSND